MMNERIIKEDGRQYIVSGDYPNGAYSKSIYNPISKEQVLANNLQRFKDMRNEVFSRIEWVKDRHNERLDMQMDDTKNWNDWLNFKQALRDMPQQKDFDPINPNWPKAPETIQGYPPLIINEEF